MNEPIEELIRSLPLKAPTPECDAKIEQLLNAQPLASGPDPVRKETPERHVVHRNRGGLLTVFQPVLATAATLLLGFLLGIFANRTFMDSPPAQQSQGLNSLQSNVGFNLADNVEVVDGQSHTVIVADSVQLQDSLPIRKLETVTRKKVRVKDTAGQIEREMEIPIRKVFFTLAETI